MKKLIAYYRVSTQKQGASGLGLEAQRECVASYAGASGATILAGYEEVESGKRNDRPELAKALAHAKRAKATLIIAKLDRLARNVHFLSGLLESGTDFVACDQPHATRLTVHILAAVAEDEAKRTSDRTKAALAAYKARGGKLGTPGNLSAEAKARGQRAGAEAVKAKAAKEYADLVPMLRELRDGGASLRQMAGILNGAGHTTRSGVPWNHNQVKRVLARVGA